MRHTHLLLSESESQKVIDEVNAWCRRTGTNYNKLVIAARVNVSTRHYVQVRHRRLTEQTADRLRAAMKAYPFGIAKDEHRERVRVAAMELLERQRAKRRRDYPAATSPRPVVGEPCFRCGARYGCGHVRRFECRSVAS